MFKAPMTTDDIMRLALLMVGLKKKKKMGKNGP